MKSFLPALALIVFLTDVTNSQDSTNLALPAEPLPGAVGESSNSTAELDFVQRSDLVLAKIKNDERGVDPFGFPMDPLNAVEDFGLSEAQIAEIEDGPALDSSALQQAVATLPISGIYPGRQTVVIGARSFLRGEQFGMQLEDLTIRLQMEGIKGSKIMFRDMDTREVAIFDFNPTPQEFEPITRNTKQPVSEGIVPMSELFIIN